MERLDCKTEFHKFGGDGVIYHGRVEQLLPSLTEQYCEKIQMVYLDPPFEKLNLTSAAELMERVIPDCHKMLSNEGSIFVQVDSRFGGRVRTILDDVFGEANFVNEIIWINKTGGRATKHFSRKHETILFYRKSREMYFDIIFAGVPRGSERRNHLKRRADEDGRIYYVNKSNGREYRYYEDDLVFPSDVWDDIEQLRKRDEEQTGYKNQRPEALLKRIIGVASREGDIVFDPFAGSGTTAAAAAKLNRRFVCIDSENEAIMTMRKRMLMLERNNEFFVDTAPLRIEYANELVMDDVEVAAAGKLTETAEGPIFTARGMRKKKGVHDEGVYCVYAAVGRAENGVFYPEEYLLNPGYEEKLYAKHGQVLEIITSSGKRGFFRL